MYVFLKISNDTPLLAFNVHKTENLALAHNKHTAIPISNLFYHNKLCPSIFVKCGGVIMMYVSVCVYCGVGVRVYTTVRCKSTDNSENRTY